MSVAWVGAGISAVSALSGASAAGDAADAQRQSAADANALSREQFEQTRADTAPTRERGNQAGNRLQYLMGLDGGSGGSAGPTAPLDRNSLRNQLLSQYTTRTAGQQKQVAYQRADDTGQYVVYTDGTQGDAFAPPPMADNGRETIDEAGLSAEIERQFAAQQAAQQASQASAQRDPEFGSLMRNFSAADRDADPLYAQLRPQIENALQRSSKFETAPGYQFRLAEGMKGVENSGAARGMQLSGAGLKAINRFNQDFASNEYGNWFNQSNTDRNFVAGQGDAAYNRFNNNNTNKYNRLAGIAGTGQQATRDVNSAGAAYAQNAGNNIMGAGNAQAAGIVGGANALNQGVSQGYNMYQNNQLMDMIRKPQGSTGWGGGGGWSGGGRVVPDYPGAEY